MNQSESLFEEYLKKQRINFHRNFPVNSHNVDFRLTKGNHMILCDVKEVRDAEVTFSPGVEKLIGGRIDAQDHIRGDIKKLRQKFDSPPTVPLMIVSMNFSSNFFTALTVSRALMGEIGVIFERGVGNNVSEIHHLHSGNAALRQNVNKSISGIFLFDVESINHCLFRSPYANHDIPPDFFSGIRILDLRKDETPEEILNLSSIMFWNESKS